MSTHILLITGRGSISQRTILALKACAIKKQAEAETAEKNRKAERNAARQRANPKFSKQERKKLSRFKLQAMEKEKELNEMKAEFEKHAAEEAKSNGVTIANSSTSSEKKQGVLDILNGTIVFMQRITCLVKWLFFISL